jgi:tryptophanyl-tRNA synthetase
VECKKRLAQAINVLLTPIREQQDYYERHPGIVDDILHAGTARANIIGQQTLEEVKTAMQINYRNIDRHSEPV